MNDSEKLDLILSSISDMRKDFNDRLTSVENRLTSVENRLTSVENRLTSVENRLTSLEERVTSLEERVTSLEGKVTSLESRMTALEEEVTDIRVSLETEIKPSIQLVAESHLDLNRNLKEQSVNHKEYELSMMMLRLHDSQIKELQKRVL